MTNIVEKVARAIGDAIRESGYITNPAMDEHVARAALLAQYTADIAAAVAEHAETIAAYQGMYEKLGDEVEAKDARIRELEEALDMRPEVLAFAWLMERELRANDYKGGWHDMDSDVLARRVTEEAAELQSEADSFLCGLGDSRKVGEEAADVGNMAMMVADVCRALEVGRARAVLTQEQTS